jgi:5-formyltetrahydrofolate cyclo-ligase
VNVLEKKMLIRKQIKEQLDQLEIDQYIEQSKKIAAYLCNSIYWKQSQVIAITIPRDTEVDTYEIIKKGWEQKKKIAVPRADFHTRKMTFYELTSFEQLKEGSFRLKEPDPDLCPVLPNYEMDLVIVPGLAFDKNGYRLGYGGGFYDRFLPTIKATTIALAFYCQLIPEVPSDKHDRKVNHIISPDGFYL